MSANQARGEVNFVAGDKTYTLRWSIAALATMEALTGRRFGLAVGQAVIGSVQDNLALFWASLQPKHAKEFPTIESASALLDQAEPGPLTETMKLLRDTVKQLIEGNQPPAAVAATSGEGGQADPPTAQAGTGTDSSSTPGAPV